MVNEQRIRAVLFYLSVIIFLIGLPFILSFALGYKFDRRAFKFTKTGLLVIKTQPSGASVYLDGKLLNAKTPATASELLPGRYHLRLELERHFPWINEVNIDAGKVTRLEKIILFPLRPNIKQVNSDRLSAFWVDEEHSAIYYVDPEDNSIYRSNLAGDDSEKIAFFPALSSPPIKWKLSTDKTKLLYFNAHQIGIVYLEPQNRHYLNLPFILDYPYDKIIDIFWHSDSYHLILVSNKNIEALEAQPRTESVALVNLNKRNTTSFYDIRNDTLYFLDAQKAEDGNFYDNLYKLDLNPRVFPFQELIKLKQNE
ncbi:MAG: PEGA domain-containing protein [Candidatus Omnitrophica bacterium]|nr:PEGA domain-containing protein [Candidatus Omnitrophota bacterium]